MKKLILASSSPRRREIMSEKGLDFTVSVYPVDEKIELGTPPDEAVKQLATKKAQASAQNNPDCITVGADTVVALGGEILGKPSSREDAVDMLMKLSGKTHSVFTGVAVVTDSNTEIFCEETKVRFKTLTEAQIDEYVATGEPMDKAGAYGIQGKGGELVDSIDGDYYNVVGLPIDLLCRVLKKYGVEI
ncbi:MAG: Maf family protein [Clostridia bacterium]|nr:Maf family protein [Clostridia bacterium]